MNIIISMHSELPIYEQLKEQIKSKIIKGTILPHTQMPSVRVLSKELKIGIITVKRAYDELVLEGYLVSKAAVGYFSLAVDQEAYIKTTLHKISQHVSAIHALLEESKLDVDVAIALLKEKGGIIS